MGSRTERSSAKNAARAVIVHDFAQAEAALAEAAALAVPVALWSPPGAASYMGAAYFQALVQEARAAQPEAAATAVLDCADDAGWALAAIRLGLDGVCFRGRADVAAKLADIAAQAGVRLFAAMPEALDLAESGDAAGACRAWLAPAARKPG